MHLIQRPQLRGAELSAARISGHLQKEGCEAVIVSIFSGDSKLPYSGKLIHLQSSYLHRFWNLRAWYKLYKIIRAEMPDIIQANAGFTLKFAVFSKIVFGWTQPIVFRNASTISLYIKSAFAKRFNEFFFRYVSKVISVSKLSALDFVSCFPQHHAKVSVVPVGIEPQPIIPPTLKTERNTVILHVGGFTFEKNHQGLLDIFEKVLHQHPNAELWLVGDGPLRNVIQKHCEARRLQDSVKFFGATDDVMQIIPRADVLVLPSVIEGLPSVILESFFCGVPVVAYDTGGVSEIVVDLKTGHLVPSGDQDQFVERIMKVLRKSDDNSAMTNKAFELVNERYLNPRIAEMYTSIYHSLTTTGNDMTAGHQLN